MADDDVEARRRFEAVLAAEGRRTTQLAFLLCGNRADAEDLAAEGYARAWRSWRAGQVDDLVPYVRQVVVNLARKRWRHRVVVRRYREQLADGQRTLLASSRDPAARLELVDAVMHLPPPQRAVVVLRYFEDLSEQATAGLLGISPGTVKSRLSRALTSLRSTYGGGPHV